MTTLLTIEELRAVVQTGLDDTRLAALIQREEDAITERLGSAPDGATSRTETARGGTASVYTRFRVSSVSAITEQALGGTASVTANTDYYAWSAEGRIERLPRGARWGELVIITYVPTDQRPRWRQAIIELCRQALEQTAMKSESVAGEYSYTAPDWERARAQQYRRLTFMEV